MKPRRLVFVALVTSVVVIAALPWILRASQRGFEDFHNVPYLWVSEDFEPRRQFDQFLQRFAHADMIVLSYEGCTVDDPRLQRLAERLMSDTAAVRGHSYRDLFPDVSTGYGALRALQEPPLELSRAAALQRLQGILVGPDGETSCALITVSNRGVSLRGELPGLIRAAAAQATGLAPDQFILAGGLLEGIEIDEESQRSSRLIVPSAAVSLLLCLFCLRSLRLALPIFTLAMLSQGLVLALTDLSDIRMNAILMVLAPLVFTITMSAGIHLANYYREERAEGGEVGAMQRAVAIGWLPCWLAIITTAIGLGSLAVSEVVPVRQFGLLGAAGSLSAFSVLFLILPGFIVFWTPATKVPQAKRGPKGRAARARRGFLGFSLGAGPRDGRAAKPLRKRKVSADSGLHSPLLQAVGATVSRHAYVLSAIMLVLMIVGMFGVRRLQTSVDVLSLLPQDSRVVQDYLWLERQLGPLVPLEFVVEFPATSDLRISDQLELLAKVQARLAALPEVGGTMSALNFLPPLPRGSGMGATVRRRVFNREIERNFDSLLAGGMVAQDEQGQAWRITVRTRAAQAENQGEMLAQLQQQAVAAIAETPAAEGTGVQVKMTGIVPLVYASQSLLLRDLTVSFLTAFLIVGAVMVAATRSLRSGLIAMLPNLFPVVLVFGVLGWAGTAVDIGAMMTASVALGIAVDGTLHFLITFRREQKRLGGEVEPAVQAALQRCGRALGHSTLICGVGLLVFCLSGFLPTQRFAVMIFALLAVSFISDVVLFPALLIGPLKRFYAPRRVVTEV